MKKQELESIVFSQREWLYKGHSKKAAFKIKVLARLKKRIESYRQEIHMALCDDLGLRDEDFCFEETQEAINLINKAIYRLRLFSSNKEPEGVALIMTPWYSPFITAIRSMVDAIVRGDTIILKLGSSAPETATVLCKMLEEAYPAYYIKPLTGGRGSYRSLLNIRYDKIYFSGSKESGKTVYTKAYEHLTPINLDVCDVCTYIVKKGDKLREDAEFIAENKFAFCGQYKDAIDFIIVDADVYGEFLELLVNEIELTFGSDPLVSEGYGKIRNKAEYERLLTLIADDRTIYGGAKCDDTLQIGPVLISASDLDDEILKNKIFGPLLPVVAMDEEEIADFERKQYVG